MTSINLQQMDALRPFAEPPHGAGERADLVGLMEALYQAGWIHPGLDWGEWQEEAEGYALSLDKTASADLATIQRLFTTHARKERFCEGHWQEMIDRGHLHALVRRVGVIRAQL